MVSALHISEIPITGGLYTKRKPINICRYFSWYFLYHLSLGPPFAHFDTRRACVKQEISVLENLKKTDWERDRKHLCSWSNFGIEYQKFRSKNIRLE